MVFVFCASSFAFESSDERSALCSFKKIECDVKGNKAYLKVNERLVIFNKRGDDFGEKIFSESEFEKFKKFSIILRNQNDEIIRKISKRDLEKVCGFGTGSTLYDEVCHYFFTPNSPSYPYSIEYNYEKKFESLFFLPNFYLYSKIFTEHLDYKLIFPVGKKVHCKQYGINIPRTEIVEDKKNIYSWIADSVQIVDYDTLSELDYNFGRAIVLVSDEIDFAGEKISGCTWLNIGKWYGDIAEEKYSGEKNEKELTREEAIEKMRASYEEISKSTRYVSVSIDVSGWCPVEAKNTKSTGYGDCKGMSTLLISELREQGIDSYPVLILTSDNGLIDTTFPNFGFNHVIVAGITFEDTVFMDLTCSVCPFGDIPSMDESTIGLMVTDTGGILVNIPGSNYKENVVKRITEINIDRHFNLGIKTRILIEGEPSHYFRRKFSSLSRYERKRYAQEMMGDYNLPLEVKKANISNLSCNDSCLQLDIKVIPEKSLMSIGNVLYINPVIFDMGLGLATSELNERKRPVRFHYPKLVSDSVLIVLDSSIVLDSIILPKSDTVSYSFGSRTINAKRFNDSVYVEVSYFYNVYNVFKEEFGNLIEYEELLRKKTGQYVKLVLSPEK